MKTRLAALALLVALAPGSATSVRADEEATLEHKVDALVERAGIKEDGPGCAVLVVTNKGVPIKKGYGLADVASHTPIATSTTFELASVSKQMCGAAVLLLVQRGKVKVEDDVRKHLPEIPAYSEEHPIHVDHLSRHTSGLPDYLSWEGESATKKPYFTNADALVEFAKRKESSPLVSTPGEKYDYSNSGYMLLGCLVERLSEETFGEFLAKEFFGPLGMKMAWVHESPKVPTATTAVGYTRDGDGWKATWAAPTKDRHEKLFTTGDGSVWASLEDLAAWEHGIRAGSPVKTETYVSGLTAGKTNGGERVGYAMGWNLEFDDHGGLATAYHSGKWGGFENYYTRDLAHGVSVVVLSNRDGFESADLAQAIAALFHE